MNTLSTSTHTIAADAVCRGMNHVLRRESWACAELAKHTEKTVLVQTSFGRFCFGITPSGYLKPLSELDNPSLALEISAKALGEFTIASGKLKEQAFKAVKITGDADLAQVIGRLAGQLRWDYEEDLAQFIGDAPAHFAIRQGKKVVSASRLAAIDLLGNVVEYVSEEKKVLLNKRDFLAHKAKLNSVREAVDRLEKRIQLIEKKAN